MSIRIQGGIYNNKRLILPSSADVRPTKSNIKRVLFDILRPVVRDDFTFMDVCAGYGTVGITALSNGASVAVFCDTNKKCLELIRKNLSNMPLITAKCMYICVSALKLTTVGKPIDVIYIDPPYASCEIIPKIVKRLYNHNWIDQNTIIVCETNRKTTLEIPLVNIIRERSIGNTTLHFGKLHVTNETELTDNNTEHAIISV